MHKNEIYLFRCSAILLFHIPGFIDTLNQVMYVHTLINYTIDLVILLSNVCTYIDQLHNRFGDTANNSIKI